MFDRTGLKIVMFVAGGALLLAGTWLFLTTRSGAEVAPPRQVSGAQDDAAFGVQERTLDRRAAAGDHDLADVPPEPPARIAAAAPRPSGGSERAPSPPQPPPPPLVLTEAQLAANAAYEVAAAGAQKAVRSALGDAKGKLKSACWQPAVGAATFSYNLSYGADGKVQAMGIGEPHTAGAGPVGKCLGAQALALDIPPPGQKVDVTVDLAFP